MQKQYRVTLELSEEEFQYVAAKIDIPSWKVQVPVYYYELIRYRSWEDPDGCEPDVVSKERYARKEDAKFWKGQYEEEELVRRRIVRIKKREKDLMDYYDFSIHSEWEWR